MVPTFPKMRPAKLHETVEQVTLRWREYHEDHAAYSYAMARLCPEGDRWRDVYLTQAKYHAHKAKEGA